MSDTAEVPTANAERTAFIRATCLHLAAAVLGFVALSALLLKTGAASTLLGALAHGKLAWLGLAGTVVMLGWLAVATLEGGETLPRRCVGLCLAVLADSLLFAPVFARVHATGLGLAAAVGAVVVVTGGGVAWAAFGRWHAPVWLDGALTLIGWAALAGVVVGFVLRHPPGPWALGGLFVFGAATLVQHGAQLLRHSPTDRPARAALNLFASAALAQWALRGLLRLLARAAGR